MKTHVPFWSGRTNGMSSPMHNVMTKYMKIMKMHRCILDEQESRPDIPKPASDFNDAF